MCVKITYIKNFWKNLSIYRTKIYKKALWISYIMDKLHGQANMYPIQYHDGLFSLETDIFMSFFFKTWFGQ